MSPLTTARAGTVLLAAAMQLAGCRGSVADPALATRPFPYELQLAELVDADGEVVEAPLVLDIHVFRDDIWIDMVNSTPRSFEDFDLWVNQRYVRHVDALPAGGGLRLSLFEFYDELGERFNAGGFFRAVEPSPVRLVQIQRSDEEPLLGLVVVSQQRN